MLNTSATQLKPKYSILLLGPKGVGKSTFIDIISGKSPISPYITTQYDQLAYFARQGISVEIMCPNIIRQDIHYVC